MNQINDNNGLELEFETPEIIDSAEPAANGSFGAGIEASTDDNNGFGTNSSNSSAAIDTSVYSPTGSTAAKKRSKKRKKRSKLKMSPVIAIILLIITCASVICSLYLIKRCKVRVEVIDGKPTLLTGKQFNAIKDAAEDSVTEDIRQLLKKRLESGDSATYLLRVYYPEYMVFMDKGIYKFTKIDNSLKMNKLKKENFNRADNGEMTYSENGAVTSHKGIDLSVYQGNVDFSKVKDDGIEYAIIRCGYRGYGTGAIAADSNWSKYAKDAKANGIKIGAYFFTQAISVDEAVEEANFVINAIKPYDVTYPVVIDVEDVDNKTSRQENLSPKELTDIVIAFCDTIKAAGYTPMIYSNINYYGARLEYSRLEEYDKWFASYSTSLYFPYEIAMWQYTNTGSVNGISGNVDINISFKDWE